MKLGFLKIKLMASLACFLSLTACSDREDGPSEIVNARSISPYYFVKKGETLADVATKHSMKESDLIALNNLKAPYTLFERQRILVRVIGKNNADYAKPNGDIMVKELDEEDAPDSNIDAKKKDGEEDGDQDIDVAPLTSDGIGEEVDSTLSSSVSVGPNTMPSKGTLAKSAANASVAFDWPVKGKILTNFGQKMADGTISDSLQISAPVGTKVKAAAAGKVQKAGETVPGFGKIVVIKHTDGKLSLYAHLKEVTAKQGQQLAQGQELGRVGKKGTQPMLLFQVRKMVGKKFVPTDPAQLLP